MLPVRSADHFDRAAITLAGIERLHRIRKGQFALGNMRLRANVRLQAGMQCSQRDIWHQEEIGSSKFGNCTGARMHRMITSRSKCRASNDSSMINSLLIATFSAKRGGAGI
jgi:hypothetical protein